MHCPAILALYIVYSIKLTLSAFIMALPNPLYTTDYGAAYVGDSLLLLDRLENDSIDLVLTSPPFALQRKKTYGNVEQEDYVDWLLEFCKKVYRVLSPTGSFSNPNCYRIAVF
jgi:site-specific DNA-methyltransferase (cytosine-N4-specific)